MKTPWRKILQGVSGGDGGIRTHVPAHHRQNDFESFSLRPLRYISKYIFIANLRFVYRKSALKLGIVAVRILLENASFRQALKPVRTSKLTFPRVIWRHPAKHPLGFRVVLVMTTSIALQIFQSLFYPKKPVKTSLEKG